MATLKAYQVAAAALMGGFPPNEVPRAVAVARGESSFSTTSHSFCCTGLWQIHEKDHAAKIKAAGGDIKDPVVNAKVAYQVWKEAGGWCSRKTSGGTCLPWTAYGSGNAGKSWKAKLKEGADAYAQVQNRLNEGDTLAEMVNEGLDRKIGADVPGPGDVPGLGELMDTAGAIAGVGKALVDFGNKTTAWISDPHSWIRVAEVVGGTILFTVGLRIAFNKQFMDYVAKPIIQAVLPTGKIGKAAQMASAAAGKGK